MTLFSINQMEWTLPPLIDFKVTNRGSVNPTPLGGEDEVILSRYAELQTWWTHNLGLQIPHRLGDEVSLCGAWRGCGPEMS